MVPKHTPFDGSSVPFGIGLKPLELSNWIEVDNKLAFYLSEKRRLLVDIPDKVFYAGPESIASQREVLSMLVEHVLSNFPKTHRRNGSLIDVLGGEFVIDLEDETIPALLKAAMMVQEDLVIMKRVEAGWRLDAASLCFPSSWVLAEKSGKVMQEIHKPVPGFGPGTRNAVMIERIFDKLKVEMPVERFNWSIYNDASLYHDDRGGEHFPKHGGEDVEQFLRVEHQTLRKLPLGGDILFTIRIHVDPLELLGKRADREELVPQFIEAINAMTHPQRVYKGLDGARQSLIERLMKVTQGS